MGAIIHDDVIYGGASGAEAIELTQAQYNALSYAEKHDETKVYYITDGQGGGGYTLPIADATTLGGIKVGENLSIDSNGVLSALASGGGIECEEIVSLSGNDWGGSSWRWSTEPPEKTLDEMLEYKAFVVAVQGKPRDIYRTLCTTFIPIVGDFRDTEFCQSSEPSFYYIYYTLTSVGSNFESFAKNAKKLTYGFRIEEQTNGSYCPNVIIGVNTIYGTNFHEITDYYKAILYGIKG